MTLREANNIMDIEVLNRRIRAVAELDDAVTDASCLVESTKHFNAIMEGMQRNQRIYSAMYDNEPIPGVRTVDELVVEIRKRTHSDLTVRVLVFISWIVCFGCFLTGCPFWGIFWMIPSPLLILMAHSASLYILLQRMKRREIETAGRILDETSTPTDTDDSQPQAGSPTDEHSVGEGGVETG